MRGAPTHSLLCTLLETTADSRPQLLWYRARRVQNMGWTPSNTLWLATRGGDVYLSTESGVSDKFDQAKLGSRGFGILDVG